MDNLRAVLPQEGHVVIELDHKRGCVCCKFQLLSPRNAPGFALLEAYYMCCVYVRTSVALRT